MIKIKDINLGYIKVYSDQNLMILDTKTKAIHSEYVVKKDTDTSRYKEIEKV